MTLCINWTRLVRLQVRRRPVAMQEMGVSMCNRQLDTHSHTLVCVVLADHCVCAYVMVAYTTFTLNKVTNRRYWQ